jgi:hypothetical protein
MQIAPTFFGRTDVTSRLQGRVNSLFRQKVISCETTGLRVPNYADNNNRQEQQPGRFCTRSVSFTFDFLFDLIMTCAALVKIIIFCFPYSRLLSCSLLAVAYVNVLEEHFTLHLQGCVRIRKELDGLCRARISGKRLANQNRNDIYHRKTTRPTTYTTRPNTGVWAQTATNTWDPAPVPRPLGSDFAERLSATVSVHRYGNCGLNQNRVALVRAAWFSSQVSCLWYLKSLGYLRTVRNRSL